MKHKYMSVKNELGKAQLTIHGFFSEWQNSAAEITRAIKDLITDPSVNTMELVLMNAYGGEVNQGFPIRNLIKSSSKPIHGRCEGIVASMATVLFTACKTREMARGGRLVVHKPSMGIYGQAKAHREGAEELDKTEAELIQCYHEDTGMSVEDIKKKLMVEGKDTYLNSDQAVQFGFASSVYDSALKDVPEDVLRNSDMRAVASFYNQQIENSLNQSTDMKEMIAFAALLGVAADKVSEQLVLEKVTAMKNELDAARVKVQAMEAEQETRLKKAVDSLVAQAVKENKITAEQADHYKSLALKDYDAVSSVLASLASRVPLSASLEKPKAEDDKTRHWSYSDYLKNDRSGKMLAALRTSDPERFKKMKANPTQVIA